MKKIFIALGLLFISSYTFATCGHADKFMIDGITASNIEIKSISQDLMTSTKNNGFSLDFITTVNPINGVKICPKKSVTADVKISTDEVNFCNLKLLYNAQSDPVVENADCNGNIKYINMTIYEGSLHKRTLHFST